jgi:apolipoprotein N-acyltransferase
MVQSLPMFVPDMLKTEVDILESQTYYVRFGEWFAYDDHRRGAPFLRLKRAE